MKLFVFFIIFYPISSCAMELARAQDQASRLVAQRGLQDQARLQASEEQRRALAAAVQRDQAKIAKLEAEISAMRAANNSVAVVSNAGKAHFSPAQWDKVERVGGIIAVATLSCAAGYWLGAKHATTPATQEENKNK